MQVSGASAGFVSISPSIAPSIGVPIVPVYRVMQELPDHPPSWTTWPGISHMTAAGTPVSAHITITSMNAGGAF